MSHGTSIIISVLGCPSLDAKDYNGEDAFNQLEKLSHHIPGCEPVVHGEEEHKLCDDWLGNCTQGKHITQDIISAKLSSFLLG